MPNLSKPNLRTWYQHRWVQWDHAGLGIVTVHVMTLVIGVGGYQHWLDRKICPLGKLRTDQLSHERYVDVHAIIHAHR